MSNSTAKVIVGMPAYNEEKYVGSMVLQAKQYADEVIVVDDGSADRTSRVAKMAGATVVRHDPNKGYGAAIQSLMREARKRSAGVLVVLDADSQHNPDEIPNLVKAVRDGSDVVIGSREMQSNKIPVFRRTGQRVLAKMTGIASGQKLSDTESGFRAYSSKALDELELKEKGMAVSSEIVSSAASKGLKITEIPISVAYTGDGSTLNPVLHGVGVLNRIMVMISERRPLLAFGVIGTILVLFGIAAAVIVIQTYQAFQVLAIGNALISMLFITVGVLLISTGIILSVLVKRLGRL